jgi:hypothetical protein
MPTSFGSELSTKASRHIKGRRLAKIRLVRRSGFQEDGGGAHRKSFYGQVQMQTLKED